MDTITLTLAKNYTDTQIDSIRESVENGEGVPGKDGVSPVISVATIPGGHRITITDANGTKTVDVMDGVDGEDGADGQPGKDGQDGVSATHRWNGTVLAVTSASGTSSADLKGEKGETGEQGIQGEKGDKGDTGAPGADGANGKDGVSATHSWNGTTLTVTSASGTSSADLKGEKGEKGDTGAPGADGAKGDKGDKGEKGEKGDTGATGATGAAGAAGKDGSDYVLTEADKAEIVAMMIESLGGNPVFGYVDAETMTVVLKNAPDGEYSIAYLNEDGTISAPIGSMVKDTNVYYAVTNNLTQCTNSNSATQVVEGSSYSATITAKSGYELKSVTVTMGGSPVTVSGGTISIAEVTGNIVITAVAEEVQTSGYTNLADPTSTDWLTDQRLATSYGTGKACTGMIFTNFIPATAGDVLRVKGLNLYGTTSDGNNASVCRYDSSKTYATTGKFQYTAVISSTSSEGAKEQVSVNGDVYTYTILLRGDGTQLATSETAYIRISAPLTDGYTAEDVIITINEEIA